MDEKKALEILHQALSLSKADQTEAVLEETTRALTRFAENTIHQNLEQHDHTLTVRTVLGKRIGIAQTNALDEASLTRVVEQAGGIARESPEDKDFVSLAHPSSANPPSLHSYNERTANFSPDDRARAAGIAVKEAKASGFTTFGAFDQTITLLAVANSLGVSRSFRDTAASFSLTVSADDTTSGWGQAVGRDAAKLGVEACAKLAAEKARRSKYKVELPEGLYTVILEEGALGHLLLLLGFLGFGAKTFLSGRSFMAGKMGQKIARENVTLVDDAYHPLQIGRSFDYEGVPKQKVVLIEKGAAKDVVYDTYYANKAKVASTGHALQPGNTFGPYPKNLVMMPGDKTREEIIASTDKGILITHFWYVNYLNPMKTEVTGTTRDGTFLIEKGKITQAVRDMRIEQSILEMLNHVEMVGKDLSLYQQYGAYLLVPLVKVGNFKLTKGD